MSDLSTSRTGDSSLLALAACSVASSTLIMGGTKPWKPLRCASSESEQIMAQQALSAATATPGALSTSRPPRMPCSCAQCGAMTTSPVNSVSVVNMKRPASRRAGSALPLSEKTAGSSAGQSAPPGSVAATVASSATAWQTFLSTSGTGSVTKACSTVALTASRAAGARPAQTPSELLPFVSRPTVRRSSTAASARCSARGACASACCSIATSAAGLSRFTTSSCASAPLRAALSGDSSASRKADGSGAAMADERDWRTARGRERVPTVFAGIFAPL